MFRSSESGLLPGFGKDADLRDRTVEPDEDVSLEGWTSCTAFTKWTSQVCKSPPHLLHLNSSSFPQTPRSHSKPLRKPTPTFSAAFSRSWANETSPSQTCITCLIT
jgi:hypothetical protein